MLPLIILFLLLPGEQVHQAAPSQLVFNHVIVIDMTGAPPQTDMTVVIKGTRIIAIGRSSKIRIARDTRVIDATGKYLIPGLWDMHTHLGDDAFDRNSYPRLFIGMLDL